LSFVTSKTKCTIALHIYLVWLAEKGTLTELAVDSRKMDNREKQQSYNYTKLQVYEYRISLSNKHESNQTDNIAKYNHLIVD